MSWKQILEEGIYYYQKALADLDMSKFNYLDNPQVGDLVYETSHPNKERGFGFLIAVDYNSGNPLYWIINVFDKKVTKCENCNFVRVSGHRLSSYKEFKKIEKKNNKENDHG